MTQKNILAIIGSASADSSNLKMVEYIAGIAGNHFQVTIFNSLKSLPHFDPELSAGNPPAEIIDFRENIHKADAVIICTPEYIYSIPSGLKNAIEWCIATTIFTDKPCALITAAAGGDKAHEELQLILTTALAKFTTGTTLLIRGARGKFDENGKLADAETKAQLQRLTEALHQLIAG